MKQCSKCGILKDKTEYYKQGNGLKGQCKSCYGKLKSVYKKTHRKHYNKLQYEWNKKTNYGKKYLKKVKDKYGIGAGTIARYTFRLAIKIYDKFDRKCYRCGSDSDLTIHHIDHKGSNYVKQGLESNNNINNLLLVCRKCHGSIHGKEHGKKFNNK